MKHILWQGCEEIVTFILGGMKTGTTLWNGNFTASVKTAHALSFDPAVSLSRNLP